MSKYHELNVIGKLWVQRVNDISTYTHNGSVEVGRLIYDRATEQLFYGTGTAWRKFNGKYDVIPQGTKILMGRFPLPTGWNIVAAENDKMVILTSEEADIGNTGGDWTITGIQANANHDHGGYTGPYTGNTVHAGDSDKYGSTTTKKHTHSIGSDGSHFHSFNGSWRPYNNKYCIAEFA